MEVQVRDMGVGRADRLSAVCRLWCSALVCDIHDDDETARFGMMATLLFRNDERLEEPCAELRRRWRMARDFDQNRVYTGRWGATPRGSVWPVAEVNEDA